MTVDQSGQKSRNGETIAPFFAWFLLHKIGCLVFDVIIINYPMKVSNF